jgi:hypothetical protein
MKTKHIALAAFFLASAFQAPRATAAMLAFDSKEPSTNDAVRTDWLDAVGISVPVHLVDFESDFKDGQNISGTVFAGGMQIYSTAGSHPSVLIESDAGGVGGSNPVGEFSATHVRDQYLVLNFTDSPVDYVGFLQIDSVLTCIVTFVGDDTESYNPNATGSSGDTAQFVGFFRNDMPKINKVEFSSGGDNLWGIDNIEYGAVPVPEPSGSGVLMGLGLLGLVLGRRR